MGMQIESGDHNSFAAKVTSAGKLKTDSETTRSLTERSNSGDAFYAITNGFIPLLTATGESAVFYIKNTSASKQLRIAQLRTCGSVVQQWRMYKNPTGGTLISAGTEETPGNVNFQSGVTFDGQVLIGADGSTITGGTTLAQWINNPGHTNTDFDGSIILGNGDSFALACNPGADGDVCISALVYFV